VAAGFDLLHDLRVVVADAAVQQDGGGQLQLVEDLEQPPVADPVAVVAPGEVTRGLLAAADRIHPQPSAEREMLDIERDVEGEPLASRPAVVFPLDDRRIGVSAMAGKFQHGCAPWWLGILARMRGGLVGPLRMPTTLAGGDEPYQHALP